MLGSILGDVSTIDFVSLGGGLAGCCKTSNFRYAARILWRDTRMRGRKDSQTQFFYSIDVEARIRPDHPLRVLKRKIDSILAGMDALFSQAYSEHGRPSVPPERLLKAMLLMALYSIRSERQLCERMDMDLLFRWFLDMSPE